MSKERYEDPVGKRYASERMQYIFSDDFKFRTWRKLWIALAECQKELGLSITDEQIEEMKSCRDSIDYDLAEKKEKELRHDVMAHIQTFAEQCPEASSIIHLGATSAFVGDNTDLIRIKEGLKVLRRQLMNVIEKLRDFSMEYRDTPTLGYTHFQPAQPTTVGKRASLWLYDFVDDFRRLDEFYEDLPFRGVKGTTGTQASFMKLFGDAQKVRKLDKLLTSRMGFEETLPVTGQTYPRKLDSEALQCLASIGQSCGKFSSDVRLLQHLREIEEPFRESQVGSSAMPYKRNPMRCERLTSLSRLLSNNVQSAIETAQNQWFERTLDDSAGRRVYLPQSFLLADSVLILVSTVVKGFNVHKDVIEENLEAKLPFMATENILMKAVDRGGNRQELHERIRKHAMEASEAGDLLKSIAGDEHFDMGEDELQEILAPDRFTGRAPSQVEEFIEERVDPLLKKHQKLLEKETPEVRV